MNRSSAPGVVASGVLLSAGRALRSVRTGQHMSLSRVERLSNGRFKASAVGGYERGERAISLDRFCELSFLYGVAPPRLLADALERSDGWPSSARDQPA
jgi:transcriptional regulator with XRE-family HTH domain